MTSSDHLCVPRAPQRYGARSHQHCCICSGVLNAKRKDELNAMTRLPKEPKAARPDFTDSRKACRTPAEREQLDQVIRAGWTSDELHEFARLYFFKNGRDYPTATSYRRAIEDIAGCEAWTPMHNDGPSYEHPCSWLKLFRKGRSKPLPPRREGLLQRGRGLSGRISDEEYSWPGHTEEYRSLIEQRARDYFKIAPDQPMHVNAWAASQRAYGREQYKEREALRKKTEAAAFYLAPKSRKKLPKGPRRKFAPQFDSTFWGQTLKPHFNYEFPGHTEAFREEVAARARQDRGKKSDAYISPHTWKVACHKHYVLIKST